MLGGGGPGHVWFVSAIGALLHLAASKVLQLWKWMYNPPHIIDFHNLPPHIILTLKTVILNKLPYFTINGRSIASLSSDVTAMKNRYRLSGWPKIMGLMWIRCTGKTFRLAQHSCWVHRLPPVLPHRTAKSLFTDPWTASFSRHAKKISAKA